MKKIIVLTVPTLAYLAGNIQLECMDPQPSHKQEQQSCIQYNPHATQALLTLSNTECDAEHIRALLDLNADLNATTTDRMTPLHFAAQNGRDDLVHLFLERGAYPGAQNECGMTPLHCAAYAGRISTIQLILDHGIPPDKRARLFSPLHFAICYHQLAAARLLTQRGANIHALSPSGFEPRDFWRGRPAQAFL